MAWITKRPAVSITAQVTAHSQNHTARVYPFYLAENQILEEFQRDWFYRMTALINSRGRRLYLSLGCLLRVIERMDRLDLSVYDVNPVKNVIDSIHRLHVEDSCNVVSLDDVLL
jgi:hypothetical protein